MYRRLSQGLEAVGKHHDDDNDHFVGNYIERNHHDKWNDQHEYDHDNIDNLAHDHDQRHDDNYDVNDPNRYDNFERNDDNDHHVIRNNRLVGHRARFHGVAHDM